jgi:hypothetical protein
MRFIAWVILSIVIALPAVGQLGVRTARWKGPKTVTTVTPASGLQPESRRTEEIPGVVVMDRDDLDGQDSAEKRREEAAPDTSVDSTTGQAVTTEDADDCTVHTGGFPTFKPGDGKTNPTICLYNQFGQEYLKYANVVNSSKATSVTMEILGDAFGPVRVTLSTAVAANTDGGDDEEETPSATADGEEDEEPTSTEDKALNLLGANGGNVAVTAALPFYYRPFKTGGRILWNGFARLGGNVQAFGEGETTSRVDWNDTSGSLELAFSEFHLDMMGSANKLNLLAYAKTSAVTGTEAFKKAIGAGHKTFLSGQVAAGVRVSDLFNVFVTYNWYSDDKIPGGGVALAFTMGK